MKLIYIAGPFSAKTAWAIENNVRRAESVAFEVAESGAMPVCPHANTRFFFGHQTEEFWYAGTMELLTRCDILVLVDGWEMSKGSINEHGYATSVGMPIFTERDVRERSEAWMEAIKESE